MLYENVTGLLYDYILFSTDSCLGLGSCGSDLSFCILMQKVYLQTFFVTNVTSCAGGRHNMPRPCKLTFDLLTLKVVSESSV